MNPNERFNIKNIAPMAITDLVISAGSKLAILFNEAAKIPNAPAIATNELTLTPVVNALSAFLISAKNAEIFLAKLGFPSPPNILLMVSVMVSNKSVKLDTLLIIPPPRIPAKISPIETLSDIHPNTLVILSQIPVSTLEIP